MLTPKTLFLGALAATLALIPALRAAGASSPWSLKLRATYLATVDESSGALGKDVLSVDDKLIPEFDIGYRLSPSWSVELVATIPQEQTVNLKGVGEIGTFQHLPPTLLLQYRPQVSEVFHPYVGAGVNYTFIFDDDLLGGAAKLENGSVGPAAQLGFDVKLADHWSVNIDVKRILIRSDVTVAGQTVAEARLDAFDAALGLDHRDAGRLFSESAQLPAVIISLAHSEPLAQWLRAELKNHNGIVRTKFTFPG